MLSRFWNTAYHQNLPDTYTIEDPMKLHSHFSDQSQDDSPAISAHIEILQLETAGCSFPVSVSVVDSPLVTAPISGPPEPASLRESETEWKQFMHQAKAVHSDRSLNSHIVGTREAAIGSAMSNLLARVTRPVTNLERSGTPEALYLSTDEATAAVSGRNEFPGPIITEGQQIFQFKGPGRPIEQLLAEYPPTLRVSVQDFSGALWEPSFRIIPMSDLQTRFLSAPGTIHQHPWNALDLYNPFPEDYPLTPRFLVNSPDCRFLHDLKSFLMHTDSASRPSPKRKDMARWYALERDILLAEPHAATDSHQDGNGMGTWLTVNEGRIGFGWLSRPSPAQTAAWKLSHESGPSADGEEIPRQAQWRAIVLQPGQTVYFPGGTIHFVFRPEECQTLVFSGHVLRRSQTCNWIRLLSVQLRQPQAQNEDMETTAKDLVRYAVPVLRAAVKRGWADRYGGVEEIERFMDLKKVSKDAALVVLGC